MFYCLSRLKDKPEFRDLWGGEKPVETVQAKVEGKSENVSSSVLSDSVTHGLQPTRLPVPGILQARTLEWVAISFSNA